MGNVSITVVLNLGTSCQLGKVYNDAITEQRLTTQNSGQIFPYFGKKKLALVASLNGGNVLQEFAQQWFLPFMSCTKTKDERRSEKEKMKQVYEIMIEAGMKSFEEKSPSVGRLKLSMPFFCERGSCGTSKLQRSSLENITPANCSLGQLSLAVHKSVIENIKHLSSITFHDEVSEKEIIAVGSVFKKNKLLEMIVKEEFPRCLISEADSSLGAAQYLSHLSSSNAINE